MFQPNYVSNQSSNYPVSNDPQMQFTQFQYSEETKLPPNVFQPEYPRYNEHSFHPGSNEFEEEPPLLEELGINFAHIRKKTLIVLNPFINTDKEVLEDTDLAGPLVFGLLFGMTLLFAGKIHFNYIYGIGVLGCIAMYGLLAMMSNSGVSAMCVVSTLGYCLLPMCLLSLTSIFLTMKSLLGVILTSFVVMWCSMSSSKLFVKALDMQQQQALVAYPCCLVYGVFALLSVF